MVMVGIVTREGLHSLFFSLALTHAAYSWAANFASR
jgi:hypothetical protein